VAALANKLSNWLMEGPAAFRTLSPYAGATEQCSAPKDEPNKNKTPSVFRSGATPHITYYSHKFAPPSSLKNEKNAKGKNINENMRMEYMRDRNELSLISQALTAEPSSILQSPLPINPNITTAFPRARGALHRAVRKAAN
jgi:hypothetical protein